MPRNWTATALSLVFLAQTAPGALADRLTLACKNAKGPYKVVYDTQSHDFQREDESGQHAYKVVRTQFDNGDGLVWGQTRQNGGDVLAFFGSKTMMKYFFGNGSETTDACVQL